MSHPAPLVGAVILRGEGGATEEDLLVERLSRGGVRAAAVAAASDAPALLQDWDIPPDKAVLFAAAGSAAAGGSLNGGPAHLIPWDSAQGSTAAVQGFVQLTCRLVNNSSMTQQQQQQQKGQEGEGEEEEEARSKQQSANPLVVVGYTMKPSRERQLADQGLLPLIPRTIGGRTPSSPSHPSSLSGPLQHTQRSVVFCPLDLSKPLSDQPKINVLLHKASDELVSAGGGGSGDDDKGPVWSEAIGRLRRELEGRPDVRVVDPFEATAQVVDRAILCRVLEGLGDLQLPGGTRVRAPRHLLVDSLAETDLLQRLDRAGLSSCPLLVKPVPACGLPESHAMALVLHPAALHTLAKSPNGNSGGGGSGGGSGKAGGGEGGGGGWCGVAAIVQEFVNHGGLQYKAYVIADKVFYATRASIPDVLHPSATEAIGAGAQHPSAAAAVADGNHHQGPLERWVLQFDSLASLPTRLPQHMAAGPTAATAAAATGGNSTAGGSGGGAASSGSGSGAATGSGGVGGQQKGPAAAAVPRLDAAALQGVAAYLRSRLGLTLFGFDIVVDRDAGEWLVVDVNYFPNYKGGPPETADWFAQALADAAAAPAAG